MSDFGSAIDVQRLDGKNMEEQDRDLLDRAIHNIQSTNTHQDVTGEPFSFKVTMSNGVGGVKNLAVILSQYWLEGIDEGEYNLSVEEILATDLPKAQAVREQLAAEMGTEYNLEVDCDCW